MLKMKSINKERQLRLPSKKISMSEIEKNFKKHLKKYGTASCRARVFAAYKIANQIKYHHAKLSKAEYIVHPVRIACLAMQLIPPVNADTIIIALLHNVLEVSDFKIDGIRKQFNDRVAESIKILTVNRSRQGNPAYKTLYYKKLIAFSSGARIIKALDKLDNLFLLCNNPDSKARETYLKEIEKHIIPIVDRDLSELSVYYRKLVKNCREISYYKKQRQRAGLHTSRLI